jgi:hypothetical protein
MLDKFCLWYENLYKIDFDRCLLAEDSFKIFFLIPYLLVKIIFKFRR